jgi:hypothetical protein
VREALAGRTRIDRLLLAGEERLQFGDLGQHDVVIGWTPKVRRAGQDAWQRYRAMERERYVRRPMLKVALYSGRTGE